jgi:hypothetical protein
LELWETYLRVEEQLIEQNRLKQELLIQARNAPPPEPINTTDPLRPDYQPDPIDRHCVAGPDDEPFETYWARERAKLRDGRAEVPTDAVDALGETWCDAPVPRHREPDDVDRALGM